MLCLGDVHGDVERVEAFLSFAKGKDKIVLGDYCDDFVNTPAMQLYALKTLVESDAILLWGNHDLHYLSMGTKRLMCSGYNRKHADSFNKYLIGNRDRFKAAYADDEFIYTHAGLHDNVIANVKGKKSLKSIADNLNERFNNDIFIGCHDSMFNCSIARGGMDNYPGIFWCDFDYDQMSKKYNQVVGHTQRAGGRIEKYKNGNIHVCCDTRKFNCFDTETKQFVSTR